LILDLYAIDIRKKLLDIRRGPPFLSSKFRIRAVVHEPPKVCLPRGVPLHLGNLLSQVGEDFLCFLCIYEEWQLGRWSRGTVRHKVHGRSSSLGFVGRGGRRGSSSRCRSRSSNGEGWISPYLSRIALGSDLAIWPARQRGCQKPEDDTFVPFQRIA